MSSKHTSKTALERCVHISLRSFAFCSVLLLAGLASSRALILPEFTSVEVDGKERNLVHLQEYKNALVAQLQEATTVREQLVHAVQDTAYIALRDERSASMDVLEMREYMYDLAADFHEEQGNVVAIHSLVFSSGTNSVQLTGDVRNVGPRSMTLLAQFVEYLRNQPDIRSVSSPGYVRNFSEDIGHYSPFSLSISLQ